MGKESVFNVVENDEYLKKYLSKDPQNSIVNLEDSLSFPEQIKKLSDAIDLVTSELKQKIRQDYPSLLKHSTNAAKIMAALESLDGDLKHLQINVDNLKSNVYVPYAQLEQQIKVLERLHNVTQLLRRIYRFLQLYKKMKDTKDLDEQANILYELEPLVQDRDLIKIEILIDERAAVINNKQRLLHIANRDLCKGIQENDDELIKRSLQIYKNLNMLDTFLNNQIESNMNEIKLVIKQCFNGADLATLQKTSIKCSPTHIKSNSNVKHPGKVPQLSTSMNFRNKLMVALEWLFTDELFSFCEQAMAINRSLRRITSGLITENPGKDFIKRFSNSLCEVLKQSFEESPAHVLQNLQQSLPKLLCYFNIFQQKTPAEIELTKEIFSSLNSGYIEKCAANLKIPHESINEEVVDQILKNASAEVTVSLIDEDLLESVVNVLCACNQDFWNKIKSTIRHGSDAEQVLTLPNATQVVNVSHCNLIFHHQTGIESILTTTDLEKKNKIIHGKIVKNLEEGRKISFSVLEPLKNQMMSTISIILLSMHREPSINTENINVSASSLYMRELQEFLNRSWTIHMSPFNDKPAVNNCAKELCMKIIENFIHNISILRPISKKGRQRIQSDCALMETLLKTIVSDLSQLGNHYRMLRSIASMIVETPENLVEMENTLIPNFVVLFMLFGHGAEDLMSPHRSAGWSDEKLIQWLENKEHKEREKLELISGALQKYRTIIRKKNLTQYDPVYPLISSMLEKCLKPYNVTARGLL